MQADIKWLDDPQVFRVGQLAAHSDHKIYANENEMERQQSSLRQSLDGKWQFAYSVNPAERPADFYHADYDTSGFGKIEVPCHIQMAGYDRIQYVNTMYPVLPMHWERTGQRQDLSVRLITIRWDPTGRFLIWMRDFAAKESASALKVWSRPCMCG